MTSNYIWTEVKYLPATKTMNYNLPEWIRPAHIKPLRASPQPRGPVSERKPLLIRIMSMKSSTRSNNQGRSLPVIAESSTTGSSDSKLYNLLRSSAGANLLLLLKTSKVTFGVLWPSTQASATDATSIRVIDPFPWSPEQVKHWMYHLAVVVQKE